MKRPIKWLGILGLTAALALAGCGEETNLPADGGDNGTQQEQPQKVVVVRPASTSVLVQDTELEGYDYTKLFLITEDGAPVEVLASYIDASAVKAEAGLYEVVCTYGGQSAKALVQVKETAYRLNVSSEEVTVKISEAQGYDLKALFTATADGRSVAITDDMMQTDYKPEQGDYTCTVTFHGITKTVTVHVVPDHTVEAVLSYAHYELPINEVENFDATVLFSLYADGAAVKVTAEMIDDSALKGEIAVGQTYDVTLDYTVAEGFSVHKAAKVRITSASEVSITARDIETYPNGEVIDLTTLFTITKNGESIPVTASMIEGAIDYSTAGENEITLTYEGKTATAKVTVRLGVIIEYAHGEEVSVRLGTKKETYPFADDFIVLVNGVRYRAIPDECFDFGELDFDEEGTYEVTLTLTYGDKPNGGDPVFPSFPEPVTVTKTITYRVTSVTYELSAIEETVLLPEGTESYNYTKNVSLDVDGVRQGFTTNPDYASLTTTYYKVKQEADFTSPEAQKVILELYVFGPDEDPVEISFFVQVASRITIEAKGKAVFEGSTLYTRDLFVIEENGEPVEITEDMLSGKVDTFTSGVYTVKAQYKGHTATTQVVVYSQDMIGRYSTLLTTIPEEEEDDDDGEGGGSDWGDWYDEYGAGSDYGAGEYSLMAAALPALPAGVKYLSDLTISEEGSVTFNGRTVYSITSIDANTMGLRMSSSSTSDDYLLHYENGIVVIDPVNSLRMLFNDYTRPLVYFSQDVWTIEEKLVVNYSDTYVLQNEYSNCYSVDCFRISSKEDDTELWYGLYVRLVEHTSGDTVYDVRWGEVTLSEGFKGEVGEKANLQLGDLSFDFTMQSAGVGKTVRVDASSNPYAGLSFNGEIDGTAARLTVSSSGGYELNVGSEAKARFKFTSYELGNMKNGGVLPDGSILLYMVEDSDYGTFSYKFVVDTEKRTFTLAPRDLYFGLYYFGEKDYLFLDGFGSAEFFAEDRRTACTYTVAAGELTLLLDNPNPTFTYGSEASFYVAPLLNVLTVKSSKNDVLKGKVFTNTIITDGAIVTVNVSVVTSGRSDELLNGITILTKDGELTGTAKSNAVDTKCINFGENGFYEFSISVEVGGEKKVSKYAVQVFKTPSSPDPLATSYGLGVLGGANLTLALNGSGTATVSADGVLYTGTFTISADRTHFYVKAYSAAGAFMSAEGTVLADGVVKVECAGAVRRSDYFAKGSSVAGTAGTVVRRLTASDGSFVYTVAASASSLGEVLKSVEATSTADVYKFTKQDGSVFYARVTWGNDPAAGLTVVEETAE